MLNNSFTHNLDSLTSQLTRRRSHQLPIKEILAQIMECKDDLRAWLVAP